MNERQYNSKLINDKLSEIPVVPNELLWAKLEAELINAQPATPEASGADSAGSAATKAGTAKLVTGIFTAVVTIAVLIFVVFKKPEHPSTPNSLPPQQVPSAPKADSIKADSAIEINNPKQILRSLPQQQKAGALSDQITTDSIQPAVIHQPRISIATEPTEIKVDSLRVLPPASLNIPPMVADTTKALPVKKKEEGYYFDVQKKKKRKDN